MAFFEANYEEMLRVMNEITGHQNQIDLTRKQLEWLREFKGSLRSVEISLVAHHEGPGDKQRIILDRQANKDTAIFLEDLLTIKIAERKQHLDALSDSLQVLTEPR